MSFFFPLNKYEMQKSSPMSPSSAACEHRERGTKGVGDSASRSSLHWPLLSSEKRQFLVVFTIYLFHKLSLQSYMASEPPDLWLGQNIWGVCYYFSLPNYVFGWVLDDSGWCILQLAELDTIPFSLFLLLNWINFLLPSEISLSLHHPTRAKQKRMPSKNCHLLLS